MKISSNMVANMMVNNLNIVNGNASTAMQRLSSGLKINSAKDNAAGQAIANKLNAQVKGLRQASQNVMSSISLVQTSEGALNEIHDMLTRMKELGTQIKNGTLGTIDQEAAKQEMDGLYDEIQRTGETTSYNGLTVLNSPGKKIKFQVGANQDENIELKCDDVKVSAITDLLTDIKNAPITSLPADMNEKIDKAIDKTSTIRGVLGAIQNRLEHISANLGVSEENMTSSLSVMQDADMAEEMTNYTNSNIISQAGIAMLAQANQRPQQVLQLLNS